MKKAILFTITTALCGACLVFVANEAISRELDHQEAVRVHNCANYGDHINKHYGRELCAPTING